jgi:tetratricopeptide (TPR) repeat protein
VVLGKRAARPARWLLCATLAGHLFFLNGCGDGGNTAPPGADLDGLLAAGKLAEAEKLCRELVRKDDTRANLHRGNLARVLCLRGDAVLKAAGFFDPDPKKAEEARKSERYRAGVKYFQEAEEVSRGVLDHPGKSGKVELAKVRATLGLAVYRQDGLKRAKEAVRQLKQAVAEGDRLGAAHNTLGLIYYDYGEREKAVTHFRAALQAEPGLFEASYNLAVYYEGEVADLDAEEAAAREKGRKVPADLAERRRTARRSALEYYRRYERETKGRKIEREVVRDRIQKLEAALPPEPRTGRGPEGKG